ncbi:MAG: nucleotide exchange factor GrpE [Vicinamibacteria bacterium]|nr:nucleotide exchange factor GrpE [Vicinamibacteria bacterium]
MMPHDDAKKSARIESGAESPTPVTESSDEIGLEALPDDSAGADETDALRRERDFLADQLLRKRAEFENYRKRTAREREQLASDAQADLLAGLLDTLDNLEQALRAETTDESLRSGLELIHRDLWSYLGKFGLVAHDPTGRPFNPLTDQAMLHEPFPGYDEGIVVECFRKGYLLRDRLLRPALVKVARNTTEAPEGETDASDDDAQASKNVIY